MGDINTEKMTCDNCSFCILVEDKDDCDYGEANYYYSCGMRRSRFNQDLSYICDDFSYRKDRISEFDIDED